MLAGFVSLMAFTSFSQNVGINSTGATPNASAMLDVSSNNKGVLMPNVALASTADASTIPSPATSLLVYNTATAGTAPNNVTPGYYYNSGTPASPNWSRFSIDQKPTYFTTGSQQFSTASTSSFTVPAGVKKIKVLIQGAGGGGCYGSGAGYGGLGGAGGTVIGILDVTPGEVLTVLVGAGGAGTNNGNPGSGGRGSSISRGATLLAAAGGGGGGNGNTTATGANPGFACGGGGTLGTTINGANGVASPTGGAAAGGNNYMGYLNEALAYTGSGWNTAASFTGGTVTGATGYLLPALAACQNSMFGFSTFITNGKGGGTTNSAANSAGRAGYVSIIW